MDTHEYIESGILQDYCLGVLTNDEKAGVEKACELHEEIKNELIRLQNGLEQYVVENPIWRKAALKSKIWDAINNLKTEEEKNINKLPLINKYSNHNNWLSIVQPLIPEHLTEETFMSVIRGTEKVTQLLIKSTLGHPEETHHDMHESFLILEGECVCQIGDELIQMKTGDYIEIPLYLKHNVKVLSPYIVAVVQSQA